MLTCTRTLASNNRKWITFGLKSKSHTAFTSASCFAKYIVSRASISGLSHKITLCVAVPYESHCVIAHLRILRGVNSSDSWTFSKTENFTDGCLNISNKFSSTLSTSYSPLYSFNKCRNTSASRWFQQFMYFTRGNKWCRRCCKPLILPLMLFVPSKLRNCILPDPIPLSQNILVIFSHIWPASLFPLIWTSPKNLSLTSLESLPLYLTKLSHLALWEISVVSSANVLKSVVVIKLYKRPSSRWSLIQVRYSSNEVLEIYVAWLLLWCKSSWISISPKLMR